MILCCLHLSQGFRVQKLRWSCFDGIIMFTIRNRASSGRVFIMITIVIIITTTVLILIVFRKNMQT